MLEFALRTDQTEVLPCCLRKTPSTAERSLSEIARSMTGTRWNGLVFFGVKPRPSGEKNSSGQRETADA
jgi:Protein of unknown function (DUF2924)